MTEAATTTLDRPAVDAVDRGGQVEDILGLPEHLDDAPYRVESAGLEPRDAPGGLVHRQFPESGAASFGHGGDGD